MGAFIDLTGRIFGRLTVSGLAYRRGPGLYFWHCVCICSNPCVVAGLRLRSGAVVSCGCRRAETLQELPERTFVDGRASEAATARSWRSMRRRVRCDPDYAHVSICQRWQGRDGFRNFILDMGTQPFGKTLDRWPDPFGDYEPSNCRWATPIEQAQNKTTTRWITWHGKTLCLTAWARLLNKRASWLHRRLKRMTFEKAMAPFGEVIDISE